MKTGATAWDVRDAEVARPRGKDPRRAVGRAAEGESLAERILHQLAIERSLHGHGSAVVIDHRMGKSAGYVRRLLKGEIGLQVDVLGRLLDVLEVDAADFFTHAVGTQLVPTRVLRRIERRHAPGLGSPLLDRVTLGRIERWVAGRPTIASAAAPAGTPRLGADPGAGEELARWEAQLFSTPEDGARQIARQFVKLWEAACKDSTVSANGCRELARWLGLVGSAERLGGSFHGAARCLRLALGLLAGCDAAGDPAAEAETLDRSAGLLAAVGEPEVAEQMLHRAVEGAVLGGSPKVVAGLLGRLLVRRGMLALRRRAFGDARTSFEAASAYLADLGPETTPQAWPWRFSAARGRARALAEGAASAPGMSWRPVEHVLTEARQHHRSQQGPGWWSLLQLEGRVALGQGDLDGAERALRAAATGFGRGHRPLDEILARLDLAVVLWQAGRHGALRRELARSLGWMDQLRHTPGAQDALRALARATLTGEVGPRLLRRARQAIEDEAGERSLLVGGWMP